jgi:uncharacterized membrane protein
MYSVFGEYMKIPKEDYEFTLLWVNILGFIIFIGGMMMGLTFITQHKAIGVAVGACMAIVGVFMMSIHVPQIYPEKLFVFTWYDFVQPLYYTIVLLFGVLLLEPFSQVRELFLWLGGLWIVSFVSQVLLRLAGRVGTIISYQ